MAIAFPVNLIAIYAASSQGAKHPMALFGDPGPLTMEGKKQHDHCHRYTLPTALKTISNYVDHISPTSVDTFTTENK